MDSFSIEGLQSRIAELKESIRVLQQMLDLAQNPLVTKAYYGEKVQSQPAHDEPSSSLFVHPNNERKANPSESSKARNRLSKAAYGELKSLVAECLPPADAGYYGAVTTADIEEAMTKHGYTFIAKTPKVAVNEALVALEREGKAERRGKRGLSTIWARRKQQETPAEAGVRSDSLAVGLQIHGHVATHQ